MKWNKKLAYAIGLIATDGCLSKDGRHITLVSKDIDQLQNFSKCLDIKNKIGVHSSSYNPKGKYFHIQIGNIELYRFLLNIGLTPNKSKTMEKLKIPDRYFIDYLRGYLDGDGTIFTYWDKRWRSSFMLYTRFYSGSRKHLIWLKNQINDLYQIKGVLKNKTSRVFALEFAKNSSLELLRKIYYNKYLICLNRKSSKMKDALGIIGKQADVLKLAYRHA